MKTEKVSARIFAAFSRKTHAKRKAATAQIIFPVNWKSPTETSENSSKHAINNAWPVRPSFLISAPHAKPNRIIPDMDKRVSGLKNGYP